MLLLGVIIPSVGRLNFELLGIKPLLAPRLGLNLDAIVFDFLLDFVVKLSLGKLLYVIVDRRIAN